ncbi:hypothetical protein [Mycobacterium malmoense]|uniref:hypothetical protein n=1 Tax=Mycobacterium malmoense TaxID=1780 RepID=UPI00114792F5|nr:hypothetical protein [Mycobacterium malmoense]
MTEQTGTLVTGAESNGDGRTDTPGGNDANDTGERENGSQGSRETQGLREARDRYRGERDAARDELAAARSRVEALQLRELVRLAGEHLAQPADLLALGGVALADLLDDDGNVDPDAVAEAAAALIESRPGLARNPRVLATDPTQGTGGSDGKGKPNWADLFK